jgi:tetratricopeptide (TPR) repeat protein
MATTYHELGMTAHQRGRLNEAENWYRKSLAIKEELGNRPGMADTYHQLGIIAQERGRLNEAENWYRKSLAISEELGIRRSLALTCSQLARLAEARGQAMQALAWSIRCVTQFSEFPSPLTGGGPSTLARLTRQLGMPALEAAWQDVTSEPLPQPVRDWITTENAQATPE